MPLISLKDVNKFYKNKEEKLKTLELSKKLKELEKNLILIAKKKHHNIRIMELFNSRYGSTENALDKYLKSDINTKMLEIENKWKQDINELKKLIQNDISVKGKMQKPLGKRDLAVKKVYEAAAPNKPAALKVLWAAATSSFWKGEVEKINTNNNPPSKSDNHSCCSNSPKI